MPFLLRETGPSRPPSPGPAPPVPPIDTLPSYEHSPMPHLNLADQVSQAFEHPATVPPSPYEMPVPVPVSGSHSPAPLEIVLANDDVVFRGVGQDVESALLSGSVILNLSEATNIREITLQLTGKIRIQLPEATPHARQGHHSHVVYSHDWSFLEGERNHKHTIKAGQHVFPFQIQLPSSLPCSNRTWSGSANVMYKLRATAVRSAFSANFHAFRTFNVMRSFLPESIEYNQTLEIENTWPGKIMYSFIVPHKAFAAGDDIPVLVKFQPMAKGVSVQSVTTTIKEYTSVRWRGLQHQETRTVASAKHEIRNRRAVLVNPFEGTETPSHSAPASAHPATGSRSSSYMGVFSGHGRNSTSVSGDVIGHAISRLHAASSGVALAVGSSGPSGSASGDGHDGQPVASTSRLSDEIVDSPMDDMEVGDDEVDTSLHVTLPGSASPSSSIEPILTLYKVKFSVIISNMDGHTSELRCALPIHVMDPRLREEVRLATAATRSLLFGSENAEETQNIELPSYQAHVLDRIAVADVSQSTRTVSNPLSRSSSSANVAGMASPGQSRPGTGYFNIRSTPSASVPGSPGPSTALDTGAVDSELLLSIGVQPNTAHLNSGPSSSSHTPPESRRESRAGSRAVSRAGSRAGSRASSPERGHHAPGGVDGHKLAGALHSNRSSLFHFPSSMKPFTPFTKSRGSTSANGNHSHGHNSTPGSTSGTHTPANHHASGIQTPANGTHSPEEPAAATDALNRVPDYSVASRGFLGGGVTPLSRDLPSYDQAQQTLTTSSSAGNLVELAARAEEGVETASRPDNMRRSTGDLLTMRSGTGVAPSCSLHVGTSGSQPVR
ncbi:arrestin [Ceratobasidium sp. AG-Ba]|nr:arrestin [Ceratobasidium sp. AG-Ba]QRW08490.1 arrestin [Ceratobasidium sp. AG-Ba]